MSDQSSSSIAPPSASPDPFGASCLPQEGIELDRCCLVGEIYGTVEDADANVSSLCSFVVVHDLSPEVAEAAMNTFHRHADLLFGETVLKGAFGLPDGHLRILYVDDARTYLSSTLDADLLRELPAEHVFHHAAWDLFRAWMTPDADRRHPMDVFLAFAELAPSAFWAKPGALERVEALLGRGVVPVGTDADAQAIIFPGPSLTVCAQASRSKYGASIAALASPIPLVEPHGGDAAALSAALEALRGRAPWMGEAVDAVERELLFGMALGNTVPRLRPLLLSGPSGSGKTRFARMLAETLGLGFSAFSFAGSTDSQAFEGTAWGWLSSKPSWPVGQVARLGTANPMLFVDEVDKVSGTHNGDPRMTLVDLLDRERSATFFDHGMNAACDLSRVCWILAANETQVLDVALRDRIDVVKVSGPGPEHLPAIVEEAIAGMAVEFGVDRSRLPSIGDVGLARVEEAFRTKRSMRAVVRIVQDLVRRSVLAGCAPAA